MITDLKLPAGALIAPDFNLTIKDKALERSLSKRVVAITMTDNSALKADELKIVFDDSDGQFEMPERGAVLTLHLGWKGQPLYRCGSFTVDSVIHSGAPDILTVIARSADLRGSLNKVLSYSYDDWTLGAIVRMISKKNNLNPPVLPKDIEGIHVRHIDQTNETDLQFLTRLASCYGAQITVKEGAIGFTRPGYPTSATGRRLPVTHLERSDGDSHSFTLNDREAYSGVSASWLDVKTMSNDQVVAQRNAGTTMSQDPLHPAAKPKVGTSSETAHAPNYMVGDAKNVLTLKKIYPDEESAKHAADAIFKIISAGVATFSINLALGRPDLFTQTPVVVSGFKEVINRQQWIITKLEHSLSASGLTTKLSLALMLEEGSYVLSESQN